MSDPLVRPPSDVKLSLPKGVSVKVRTGFLTYTINTIHVYFYPKLTRTPSRIVRGQIKPNVLDSRVVCVGFRKRVRGGSPIVHRFSSFFTHWDWQCSSKCWANHSSLHRPCRRHVCGGVGTRENFGAATTITRCSCLDGRLTWRHKVHSLLLRDRTRYAAAAGWRRYARRRRRSAGRLFAVVSSRTTCALRSYRSSATAAANPLAVCTCGPHPDAAGPTGRGSREGPGGVRGPETRRLLAAARSRPCVTRKYAVYTIQI